MARRTAGPGRSGRPPGRPPARTLPRRAAPRTPASLDHPQLSQPVDRLSPATAPEAHEDLAGARFHLERGAVLLREHFFDAADRRRGCGEQVEEAVLVAAPDGVVKAGGGLEGDARVAAAGDHETHLLERGHERP